MATSFAPEGQCVSEGNWAHEIVGTSGCIENKQSGCCNVLVQCVSGPGWDKEPAQAEMRLTILLMGFR